MMQQYKADLHIHTALSPCADLSMSPAAIVQTAKERGLHLIGIADHNSTLNALVVKRLAAKEGIAVLTGVETRTSSPLRIDRGEDFQSLNTPGLFPAGEGAGYAGGILSAGVDGIKVGEAVARSLLGG